ncbi:MAG: 30S ribosomal protein S3 [Nitrosopumilus sp. H8]|nr:MAG: 30S ribosomal protein S3 [Nitrosopumilus sp. H8]
MSAVKNMIKDNYNMMLLRDYLRATIKDAGFSHADIAKTPTGTKVSLYVTRPGIVIGRKGSGIRAITEKLGTDFGLKNPLITVVEIDKPELSPSVMCNRMASHIERGTAFRRATMWTLKQVMENGAMGVQITISGKLRGDRSAFEKHTAGILPRAGYHAETIVDEDIAHVKTPMGLIGIRIRIAKKEKEIPEFELKKSDKPKDADPAEIEVKDESSDVKDSGSDAKDVGSDAKGEQAKVEEIEIEGSKIEVVKAEGKKDEAASETEAIAIAEEKMKSIETHEEVEETLK